MPVDYAPQGDKGKGKLAELGELTVHYEEHGSGSPLLLLHGFGGCTRNWHPFIPVLAQHFRLILPDLPGHGRSTSAAPVFSHKSAAQQMLRLLSHLGIEQAAAMGISSGGMVLLHMGANTPERLCAMVLVSATTHFPAQARAIMRRATLATMPAEVRAMYRTCAVQGEAQAESLVRQFNALAESKDDVCFTREELGRVSARTLAVHGDRDDFFPLQIAQDLCRSIPDAELWVIAGGGHAPIYDRDVRFAETAVRFLRNAKSTR